MGKWNKYPVTLNTWTASCCFRILHKEAQTRVTCFIQLIFYPLFASALRADGSSVRDVHHLKLSVSSFKTKIRFGLSSVCVPACSSCPDTLVALTVSRAGTGASPCLLLAQSTWAIQPQHAVRLLQHCQVCDALPSSAPRSHSLVF